VKTRRFNAKRVAACGQVGVTPRNDRGPTARFVRDDKLLARTLLGQVIFYVYEDLLLHSVSLKIGFLNQVQRFLG
jgi:hypothetical protein